MYAGWYRDESQCFPCTENLKIISHIYAEKLRCVCPSSNPLLLQRLPRLQVNINRLFRYLHMCHNVPPRALSFRYRSITNTCLEIVPVSKLCSWLQKSIKINAFVKLKKKYILIFKFTIKKPQGCLKLDLQKRYLHWQIPSISNGCSFKFSFQCGGK